MDVDDTVIASIPLPHVAPLEWCVHLWRRDPTRLPIFFLVLCVAALCVWLLFHAVLPILVALLLLTGAASEYLFPNTYRIAEEGVSAQTLLNRAVLRWSEARRCWFVPGGVIVSPLPAPSRRDAFRGVLLRFANRGEPGDRKAVLDAIKQYAPHLLETAPETDQTAPGVSKTEPSAAGAESEC